MRLWSVAAPPGVVLGASEGGGHFLVFVLLILLNTMSCPGLYSPLYSAVVSMELVVSSGGAEWAAPTWARTVLELLMETALVVGQNKTAEHCYTRPRQCSGTRNQTCNFTSLWLVKAFVLETVQVLGNALVHKTTPSLPTVSVLVTIRFGGASSTPHDAVERSKHLHQE